MQQYSLKELRARKDVTQKEAARNLGVSAATYNLWEQHPEIIKISNFKLLAEYFGVNILEIKS